MRHQTCTKCGYTLSPSDTACPRCGLAVPPQLTPLGGPGAPTPPSTSPPQKLPHEELEDLYRAPVAEQAPGQDPPGSLGYIKHIAKHDPLLAAVMGVLALDALISLGAGGVFGAIIPAAVFWGVYTFQLWGYWVAIVGLVLNVVQACLVLRDSSLIGVIGITVSVFCLAVLAWRREYFG